MAGMAFGTQAIDLLSAEKKVAPITLPDNFRSSDLKLPVQASAMLSRADESMNYTLAGNPYSFAGFSNVSEGTVVAQAFEFGADAAKKFAGNNIVSMNFFTPFTGTNQYINTISKAVLFFSEDLDKAPFYTQEVTLPTGFQTGTIQNSFNLTTPITVEEGKSFFAGFYFTLDASTTDYIFFDGNLSGPSEGCMIGTGSGKPNELEWHSYTNQIGCVCMGLGISGDKLPQNEVEAAAAAAAPLFYPNNTNTYQILIYNNAANPVSNIELTTKVGDQNPVAQTFNFGSQSLPYGQGGVLTVRNVACDKEGYNIPVIASVTKVNGQPNNDANPSAGFYVNCLAADNGYSRNVVVEEGTGTWCGWCPNGYTTMEALKEKYTDGTVILSAIHNDDPMEQASYAQWFNMYATGFPCGIVNRAGSTDIQEISGTEEYITFFKSLPAISKVSLTAENKDNTTLSLSADVEFCLPVKANDFALSFALTEDGVGPYDQTNYMTGLADYRDTEWYSKPNPVSLVFNDVARETKDVFGIENSLPNALEAKKAASYSTTMSLATIANAAKTCKAMVYVINQTTGAIENAAVVDVAPAAGVDDAVISESAVSITTANGGITVEGNEGLVEVYTVEGRKVAQTRASGTINLAKGIYIVKADDTVAKVLVK